jgi:hypothetical protein
VPLHEEGKVEVPVLGRDSRLEGEKLISFRCREGDPGELAHRASLVHRWTFVVMTESPVRLGLFGACSTGKFLVSRAGRYTMHRPEIQIGDSGL